MSIFSFVKLKTIQVTPVLSLGAYSANDQVGGLLTFNQVGLDALNRDVSYVLGWKIFDKKQIKAALDLFLFDQRPSAIAADNAAFAFSDADAKHMISVVSTSTYVDIAATSSWYRSWLAAPIAIKLQNGRNLYGALRTTGTPTYTGVDDLVVELVVGQLAKGI